MQEMFSPFFGALLGFDMIEEGQPFKHTLFTNITTACEKLDGNDFSVLAQFMQQDFLAYIKVIQNRQRIDDQFCRLPRMNAEACPEDNELAKKVLRLLKHFSLGNAFSVRVAVAGVLTTAANATSIILPFSSDYYDSGTFGSGFNPAAIGTTYTTMATCILFSVMLVILMSLTAKQYKTILRTVITVSQWLLGDATLRVEEEEVADIVVTFHAFAQTNAPCDIADDAAQTDPCVEVPPPGRLSTSTQTDNLRAPPRATYSETCTQTPPSQVPLPIEKLAAGDEGGWYMARSMNPDGSHVIHVSDPRFPETSECNSPMRGRPRVWCRPCRNCIKPMLLISAPHVDGVTGVAKHGIDDPVLLTNQRRYL